MLFTPKSIEVVNLNTFENLDYPFEYDHIDSDVVGEMIASVFTHNKFMIYTLDDVLRKVKLYPSDSKLKT